MTEVVPLDNMEEIEPKIEEDPIKIVFQTKLEFLNQKFYFHELIKTSGNASHYIVEDIEIDPNMITNPEDHIFYLKQIVFDNKEEYFNALQYFKKLLNYCKTPFAKTDIVKVKNIYELELEIVNYFEIVIVSDYGESDRINVAQIQRSHINNFLKNLCVLLEDLKKIQNIYHGNIFLKNIILVNGELKLSGFKPIYSKSRQKTWVNEIAKKYGVFRLDLFLIGLLWLRFLNYDIENLIEENFSYDQMSKKIKEITNIWQKDKTFDIVKKLLNLEKEKNLDLSIVVRDFDEHFILEKIQVEVEGAPYFSGFRNSIETKHSGKNSSNNAENPFLKSYNETQTKEPTKPNKSSKNEEEIEIMQMDQFTLQDQNSNRFLHDEKKSLSPEKMKNQFFKNNVDNRRSTDYNNNKESIEKLKSGSERQITGDEINVKFSFNANDNAGFKNLIPNGVFLEENPNIDLHLTVNDKVIIIDNRAFKNPNAEPEKNLKKKSKNTNSSKKRFKKKNTQEELEKTAEELRKEESKLKLQEDIKNKIQERLNSARQLQNSQNSKPEINSKRENNAKSKTPKKSSGNKQQDKSPLNVKTEKKINNQPNHIYHKPGPGKKEKPDFQKLTKKLKSHFDISNDLHRDKMFTYNRECNNKNIPFKKILAKGVQKPIEEELKELPEFEEKNAHPQNPNKDMTLLLNTTNLMPVKNQNQTLMANVSLLGDASFLEMIQINDNILDTPKQIPEITMKTLNQFQRKLRKKQANGGIDEEDEQKKKEEKQQQDVFDLASKIEKYQKEQENEKNKETTEGHQDPDKLSSSQKSRSNSVVSKNSKASRKSSVFGKKKSPNHSQRSSISKVTRKSAMIKPTTEKTAKIPENIPDYDEGIESLQELLNEGKYDEGMDLLAMMVHTMEGVKKIKLYKMLSMIAYKKKDYLKAVGFLNKGIDYIENSDVYPKGPISANFLCHLSTCYLESNNPQEALSCLFHKTFLNPENCSLSYYVLLGDCNKACKNPKAAKKAFDIPLELYLSSEMTSENKTKLFMMIDRIFILFLDFEEHEELADFFIYLIKKVQGILKINKSIVDADAFNLAQFLFHVFDLAKEKKNDHFLNFILSYTKDKKLIDLKKLKDHEKTKLCTYYFDFCSYLKELENFGNQKKLYLQYLLFALQTIEKSPVTFENDKKQLMILFQLGNLHLTDLDYNLAKLDYEKCLEVYNRNYEKPQKELFDILYNIGTCVYNLKHYEDAEFFLEQLNSYELDNFEMKNNVTKLLVRVYYILQKSKKCKDLLKSWFELAINPKKEDNFFKYFAFYNISATKSNSEMEKFLEDMKKNIDNLTNDKKTHFFTLFYNVFNVYLKKKMADENNNLLDEMNLICKTKNSKLKAQRFVSLFSYLYCKLVLNLKKRSANNIYEMIEAFIDKNRNRRFEMKNLKKFLRVMFLFLINYLNLITDKKDSKDNRISILKNFTDFKNDEEVDKILFEAINKDKKVLDKDMTLKSVLNTSFMDKDFEIKNRAVFAKPKTSLDPKKKKIVENQILKKALIKTLNRAEISEKEVNHWNYDQKEKCKCSHVSKNAELLNLIEEFMKQIKNMLFLNLKDKILEYYDALKNIMQEKKIDFEKFDYLPMLYNFQESNDRSAYFNRKKFFALLDQICEKKICIHDFEIIFLFMEAFQNVNYIESLILYIHEKQSFAAETIFRIFFLYHFDRKYQKITSELVKTIENDKYYLVENSPLVHHFEQEKILQIEKKLTFSFFQRFRYNSIVKKENEELFKNYFTEDELKKFRLKFLIYNTLVDLIRKNVDFLQCVKEFSQALVLLCGKSDYSNFEEDIFLLDLLAIFNLIKFNESRNEIAEEIISILKFLKERINQNLLSNLAFISTHIGNIFFKNSLYKYVKIVKSLALDFFSESKHPVNFNQNWTNPNLREINYDIHSYLLMNNFVLKRKAELMINHNQLKKIEPENILLKIEKMFLNLHILIYNKEKDLFETEAEQCLIALQKLKGFERSFYQAIYDKLLVDTSESLTEKEINNRRRQSRNSMQKIYENLEVHKIN